MFEVYNNVDNSYAISFPFHTAEGIHRFVLIDGDNFVC